MVSTVLDVSRLRKDFPILERTVRGDRPLVYLDSAATSQKPLPYSMLSAPITRRPTRRFTGALTNWQKKLRMRMKAHEQPLQGFVGARAEDIVFTKNATESLNLAAYAFSNAGQSRARRGSRSALVLTPESSVVVTEMEHHANLIPWQELCAKTGAQLRWIGLTEDGRLDMEQLSVIDETTAVVSIVHQSNILGTINPVRSIMDRARDLGALGVVDACQSIPHMRVNVDDLEPIW